MNILKPCSCGIVHLELPQNARAQIQEDIVIGYCFECECKSTVYVLKFTINDIKQMMADNIL